ncbi:DUF6119 family protein [Flavobacterium sp.]|uniref:DUF6119 family protein n=1 Tax=Flavobacterium sp. TaxID=239 RepID=UPI004033573A
MEENFENKQYEIKIFQIDRSHYEFRNLGLAENHRIINYVVNEHRKKVENTKDLNVEIYPTEIDDVGFYVYLYNETEKDSYWKSFIPKELSQNLDFRILQLSFVLFASIDQNIYAIVGGGGSRVIIRYQNHRFGLDFFEYITDLNEDVISIEVRGISGKLTKRADIFKDGLKLIDVLNFTNIPSKINLILKKEIKDTLFDFIDFGERSTVLEISSYFNIKHKIEFESLTMLLKKINEVSQSDHKKSLTSFIEVKDKFLIENSYRNQLILILFENMMDRYSPAKSDYPKKLDIEFVHPSLIKEFYEAEEYVYKFKGDKNGYKFYDRKNLFLEGLKLIYEKLENVTLFEFTKIVSGLHLYGMRKNETLCHSVFLNHIVCEINVENRPIFQIDSRWYKVDDNFTDSINNICDQMLENNYLNGKVLYHLWDNYIENEDSYNRLYHLEENYWVFDKAISQNIELCDVMFEDDSNIYFIHVKDGFDAKIRDLSNQIQISANRFMNERNSGKTEFLSKVIDAYNHKAVNADNLIDKDDFIKNVFDQGKSFVFVMAFRSNLKKLNQIRGNVSKAESNIAKYSLIQCVREMNTLSYPIKLFEILKS